MTSSKKISKIKKFWKEENHVSKDEIIQSDHNIIDQISQFFASGSYYYYIFNFATLKIEYVSDSVRDVLEIEPKEFNLDTMLGCYHPEDLDKIHEKEQIAVDFLFKTLTTDQIKDYKVVYTNRVFTRSGIPKTILHQAKAIALSEDGKISKVIGVHTDISYLNTPIDHNVSFISYKYPSFYSVSLDKAQEQEKQLFTKREIEVIELISKGNSIKEISKQFIISEHTVRTHRKNILRKADVKNTVHLVTFCIREGII